MVPNARPSCSLSLFNEVSISLSSLTIGNFRYKRFTVRLSKRDLGAGRNDLVFRNFHWHCDCIY
jgi:hypothetical protein